MSEWYEPNHEDIDLDFEERAVDIFVKQDYFGSVYITLTFDRIDELYKKIKAK